MGTWCPTRSVGSEYAARSYIADLSDDAITTIIEHAPRMSSPLSSFYLQHLGGAIARGAVDTAAFGHRDALFDFAILTV